jgi:hypothetical protein
MILGLFTGLWLILNPSRPTFTFVKTDQYNVAVIVFGGTPSNATNYINMTIQNTGSHWWTITNPAQVNSVWGLKVSSTYGLTCVGGASITVKIANVNWITGNQYSMVLLLTDGTKITWVATATPGGHSSDPNPSIPQPIPGPSLIAIIVADVFSPLFVASLVAMAEIVVLVGVLVYIRKHSQQDVSAPADLPKPPPILASTEITILAAFMIFIASFITFCIVYSYLLPPLVFS